MICRNRYLPVLWALIFLGPGLQSAAATSLYNSDRVSLYANRKAGRVGDLVTVHIVESAQGTNKTTLRSSKKNELEVTGSPWEEILDFIPLYSGGMGFEDKMDGQGNNSITGDLRAKVTAQVVSVLPNGNLVLEATRQIELNGEIDHLTLRGVVRPDDIGADNIVLSTYLADAQISYKGKGVGRHTAHRGIFSRILGWIF
ncbi:MAG: flagellar basal body L-ring protein FlgH [Candidatus Eisenbacteria bacterium]|uniref:Flagellar basal body L-ring protein FlgH n=1 Tax=Eiseniibacteriota bacterium TaxID=2212470 RepID=A0A948S358_UNCEI|nr:flagellar basal body L-ring protein FlgH [Candidatus Eisenbacteria bacterium]MBU1949317.1 flagellar basal body L-ring protein FlgH [Candidatus Eisenbacteria bacterium]MBU2692944.1 flagellar basal body L-ring protein FlgH [Candidatus Eisenbacteria bacterium]